MGAVVAIVYQRLAFALAGFYAGVFLTIVLAGELGLVAMPAVTLRHRRARWRVGVVDDGLGDHPAVFAYRCGVDRHNGFYPTVW